MLTILVHFQNDRRLCAPYRQFPTFLYKTMIVETQRDVGRWPDAIPKKDIDAMVKLQLRAEVKNLYWQENQWLYKTPSFGTIIYSNSDTIGEIDQKPLEAIVVETEKTAPLLTQFILLVGPASCGITKYRNHVLDMKMIWY